MNLSSRTNSKMKAERLLILAAEPANGRGDFLTASMWSDSVDRSTFRPLIENAAHAFLLADGRSLPLKTETIGRVLISGVLHHLDDRSATECIAQCVRVIGTNGHACGWEDIPISPWTNPIGQIANRLDDGDLVTVAGIDYEACSRRSSASSRNEHFAAASWITLCSPVKKQAD